MQSVIGIITLLVTLVTLYVSYITYRYAKQSDIKRKKSELARKRAKLGYYQESIRGPFAQFNYDRTTSNFIRTKIEMLKIEIKQVEKEI